MDSDNLRMSLPRIPSSSLETLYSEFARRRPGSSHSWNSTLYEQSGADRVRQQLIRDIQRMPCTEPGLDLRALDYISDYEPHLMCPICHVPFINPIALECDHCFCSTCFIQSCDRANEEEGPKCPSCRATVRTRPRKAPRLILNMCDDIKVKCPNHGCNQTFPRGHVEHHARKQCPDERVACPSFPSCNRMTKKRHLNAERCRHSTHVECECGMEVEIGDAQWSRHRQEECVHAGERCEKCNKRLPDNHYLASMSHECGSARRLCPGEEFGCGGCDDDENLDDHVRQCTIARLAPSLKSQASLLAEVRSELEWTKSRNEVLESTLDRMNDLGRGELVYPTTNLDERQPRGESLGFLPDVSGSYNFDREVNNEVGNSAPHLEVSEPQSFAAPTSQQHLLALHESLRTSFADLQAEVSNVSNNLAEVDARTSMYVMNETLRIKEDMAHTTAAVFTMRAQLNWLLNRERAGQYGNVRGRAPVPATASSSGSASTPTQQQVNGVHASSMVRDLSSEGPGGEQTAESVLANRPTRRLSGGSQERVKL